MMTLFDKLAISERDFRQICMLHDYLASLNDEERDRVQAMDISEYIKYVANEEG
jgi:hypothetical protein